MNYSEKTIQNRLRFWNAVIDFTCWFAVFGLFLAFCMAFLRWR